MKTLFLILFLITLLPSAFSANLSVGTIVNQGVKADSDTPAKVIAGSNLSNIITLISGGTSITAGNFYRLVKMGAGTNGANYQVTSGKTLYCSGAWSYATGTQTFTVGYGTAAVTDNNNTAPAGVVYFGGSSNTITVSMPSTSTQGTYKFLPFPMSFPSLSFPFVLPKSSQEFATILLCEEQ